MKISFVLIGRNEGFKLRIARASIDSFVAEHRIASHEVIYVDSASTDGSVAMIGTHFQHTRIVPLTGRTSAAIARNAGAEAASGEILFFLDGDMELLPGFPFIQGITANKDVVLLSGQIENRVYDAGFEKIKRTELYYPSFEYPKQELYFGGLFVISRKLWDAHGGMREIFVYGEDLDLSMRLAENGIRLMRYPQILAAHHTFDKRLSLPGLLKNACYSRGLLYRKHIGNPLVARRILRSDPTVPLLISCASAAILIYEWWPMAVYLVLLIAAVYISTRTRVRDLPSALWQQPLRDLFVIICFIFFHPRPGMQDGSKLQSRNHS